MNSPHVCIISQQIKAYLMCTYIPASINSLLSELETASERK